MAAGILLSRLAGLVRQRVFAHYLGLGDAADAISAAFRIPNLLQNLLGEGSLSASFIPVYARLRAQGRPGDAGQVARAVLGLLAGVTAVLVLAGVVLAPLLVELFLPGFEGAKRDLTIRLVRVLFPGTGILVLSAWCLGVLNSHGRFFLSYAAPVAWNLAIITAAVVAAPGRDAADLTVAIAWGAVAGSLLQVLVQLPGVRLLLGPRGKGAEVPREEVRTVVRNFGPAVLSRGVVQLSGWVDMLIASLMGTGAAAALANAQMLTMLPVSLFGMSVSASELPAMAAEGQGGQGRAILQQRLQAGWQRMAFYIIPSAAAFLALGHVVAGTILEGGAFTAADSRYLWLILAGAAFGLPAATAARLTASAFFALGDTRTPMRCATARMVASAGLGVALGVLLPPRLGWDPRLGVAGLTVAGTLASWLELMLLRRSLARQVGPVGVDAGYLVRLVASAGLAAGLGWLLLAGGAAEWHPAWRGIVVLGGYGAGYLTLSWLAGARELSFRFPRGRTGA